MFSAAVRERPLQICVSPASDKIHEVGSFLIMKFPKKSRGCRESTYRSIAGTAGCRAAPCGVRVGILALIVLVAQHAVRAGLTSGNVIVDGVHAGTRGGRGNGGDGEEDGGDGLHIDGFGVGGGDVTDIDSVSEMALNVML
jgi:hypothetical protein